MNGAAEFRFGPATRVDEPEIRALVGGLAMPGAVSVRFEREPDYFLGASLQGDPCDVLIARQAASGMLAGVMVLGRRRVWIAGTATEVSYIGQIRVAPRFQGRWLVQRAVVALAQLRDAARPYFGVIASDNPVALGTLAGRRPPGAPGVARVARLRSLAFVLHGHDRRRRGMLPMTQGDQVASDELTAFLRAAGPGRQLCPVVGPDGPFDGHAYRGLAPGDLSVVWRDGEIAGVLGSWDQSSFKQEIVAGYTRRLRLLRPAYDLVARSLGGTRLPRVGEPIRTTFGCLHGQVDDDPDVLAALLVGARARARRQDAAFLLVGFDERDPLLRTLGRSLRVEYRSDVFVGSFADDPSAILDARPVRVELGTL